MPYLRMERLAEWKFLVPDSKATWRAGGISRGRGIFAALFEHVERLARERSDVCGLRLYMERDNERARRVYRKMGLQETHYHVFEKMSE